MSNKTTITFDKNIIYNHTKEIDKLHGRKFKIKANVYELEIDPDIESGWSNIVHIIDDGESVDCYTSLDIQVIYDEIFAKGNYIGTLISDEKIEALEKIKILEEELANLKKIVS